jgi:hypothetical protein
MAQPQNIEDAIEQNAKGPKRVQVANQSVEQQPIADQIKADEYLASKAAAKKPSMGLRFSKIVPPGAG